ncbi:MAG: SDR family oxidoreductase [Gemmatimonadetes bacterium]|nr:SDR family oxidoreductase [Gemmatimonadota bacterium]
MDLGLQGKRALVTGASAGIGYAVARSLAREGARTAIVSRDEGRIGAAAERIRAETGGEVLPIAGDVASSDGPVRLVQDAVTALGGLDVLVTNAGGPPSGNFDDVTAEQFGTAVDLTFRSVERLVRAALPHLRAADWARVVCLTSITAKEPHDGLVLSNALRPAVHGLAKSLSRVAGPAVTVNCVCPGFTDTERLRDLAAAAAGRKDTTPEAVYGGWKANIPRGELGRPEEIADAVVFLCSERASFINGVSLAVDGGESHPLL